MEVIEKISIQCVGGCSPTTSAPITENPTMQAEADTLSPTPSPTITPTPSPISVPTQFPTPHPTPLPTDSSRL